MRTQPRLACALVIAMAALPLAGCKAKRGGPAGGKSSGGVAGVQPTPKPARQLPAIDDNSAFGVAADGVSLEMRSFYRHLTTADPIRLALRFSDSAPGAGAPGSEKQLDFHATLSTLEFVIGDPQGNAKRLKLKGAQPRRCPWASRQPLK